MGKIESSNAETAKTPDFSCITDKEKAVTILPKTASDFRAVSSWRTPPNICGRPETSGGTKRGVWKGSCSTKNRFGGTWTAKPVSLTKYLENRQPQDWQQQQQQQHQQQQKQKQKSREEAAMEMDWKEAEGNAQFTFKPYEWNAIPPLPSLASNPNAQLCPRPVVIDGSNVAFCKSRKSFSVEYLAEAIEYFQLKGHQVKAVVPSWRMYSTPNPPEWSHKPPTDDPRKLLNILDQRGAIEWSHDTSDDLTILHLSKDMNAAIVSCDGFSDWGERKVEYANLAKRVVGFKFREGRFILKSVPNATEILYTTVQPQADVNKRRK